MSLLIVVLASLAALGSALMAGAFFAFSSFIMRALDRLPAREGIAAMQSINEVVLNRSFLGTFFGTTVASAVVAILAVMSWNDAHSAWFLAGALAYVIGTFAVTGLGNVPLNNQLAAVSADDPTAPEIWSRYVVRWTRLNTVRTIAATAALGLFWGGFQ